MLQVGQWWNHKVRFKRMGGAITHCPHETVEDREKCPYYEKVSYRGSKQCTYCRVNGTCFVGGIENKFKQKGTENKIPK